MFFFVIFFSIFFFSNSSPLILEEIIKKAACARSFFSEKVVGYYIGSFDPIHKTHILVAKEAAKYCDYVLIYPTWGNDSYKLKKAPLQKRLDFIYDAFSQDEKVIVTRLTPVELQKVFLRKTLMREEAPVIKFGIKKFIGILGDDNALGLGVPSQDPEVEKRRVEHLSIYMRGCPIPKEYQEHSLGSVMALPVEEFIVNLRTKDDLQELQGFIHDRKIVQIISVGNASSSEIKKVVFWLKKQLTREVLLSLVTESFYSDDSND